MCLYSRKFCKIEIIAFSKLFEMNIKTFDLVTDLDPRCTLECGGSQML